MLKTKHQRHLLPPSHSALSLSLKDPTMEMPPSTTPSPPLSPSSSSLANSRWTPTKEQIAILEGLYKQGLRTPNAEQIQQVTARLREYGHIEGKNVFYWFQNHKARQRQKQKQQSFAYFTRMLRRPPPPPPVLARPPPTSLAAVPLPPLPPSCNNGVMYRTACYMPAPQAAAASGAYYPQPLMRPVVYPRMEMAQDRSPAQPPPMPAVEQAATNSVNAAWRDHCLTDVGDRDRETLQLFPLQPTFVLPDEAARCARSASQTSSVSAESEKSESPKRGDQDREMPPFFDFFGVHAGGPRG